MIRIMLTYGGLAGLVIITSMILSIVFSGGGAGSVWLGYLIMLVALTLVFVGIKRYRDQELGGVMRFSQGALLGLGMTVVAGLMYVLVWEIYLASTDFRYIHEYTQSIIDARTAEGLIGPELDALVLEMDELRNNYANPLFRLPMTFLELFPVGLLISLISAAILRNSRVLPATA